MRRYTLRRVLHAVPVVFGVVTVVFLLVHLLPGDPVEILLGESALPAQKEELRREMRLDRPVLVQYADFLSGLPRGDLGTSIRSREPVLREIGRRLPATLLLASTSILVAILAALRTGAALLPVYCLLEPGGRYRVVYEPEVPLEPTEDREADVLRLTRACTERVEAWVRKHPDRWLWMHRRWKTEPREAR